MRKNKNQNKRRLQGRMRCLLLLAALSALTACGPETPSASSPMLNDTQADTVGEDEENPVNPAGVGAENPANSASGQQEWVYVPEMFTVEDEQGNYVDYERMQPVGDLLFYVYQAGDTEDSEKGICRYSLSEQKLESVPISWPEGGAIWDAGVRCFAGDSSLYMTANVYPADYSAMKRFLCRFDTEGNCLFSKEITEWAGREVSLRKLSVDGQGRLYLFVDNGEALLFSGEGEYHGAVSYGAPDSLTSVEVIGACEGADGKFYACIRKESVDIGEANAKSGNVQCTLVEIDYESCSLSPAAENLPELKGICGQRSGDTAGIYEDNAGRSGDGGAGGNADSGYDLLLYDERAVYGFEFAAWKGSSELPGEELFSWQDNNINGYCVQNLYQLEDGRLCATAADWNNDDEVLAVLKKCRAEQAPRREELVLVTVSGESSLATMAVKFNRDNSRYHLTVKNYDSLTDLYNAVLTKEPMDLIDLSGVNIQRLVKAGLLEDLTPYVERSEAVDRADFVDGILEAYTFEHTLVSIPASFYLWTVVGDGAKLQNPAGLTMDELFAAADRYPGAKTFDGMTREEIMEYLMIFNQDTFIDRENGVCHFDSEGFHEVLKFVKQFPDSVENSQDEDSLPTKIRNGEVLFTIAEVDSFSCVQEFEGMFGEGAACVGFPTPDGKGGHLLFTGDAYGIAAVSENKEGAWQFIEGFLTQEKDEMYYVRGNNIFRTSFPTLKKTLEENVEASMEAGRQTAADQFSKRIYSDGTSFQYHALTWDEVHAVLELVPEATLFFSVEDDEIIKIINEEAFGYYSGQKSEEEVAGIIQNRVQLYVDEGG